MILNVCGYDTWQTCASVSAANKRGYLINSKFSALLKLLGLQKRHMLPNTSHVATKSPDDVFCEEHNGKQNAYRANSKVRSGKKILRNNE